MRFLITGCSGGGKSTLLDVLHKKHGFDVVPEPGRRIVRAVLAGEGGALPWDDPVGFALKALALAEADWKAVSHVSAPVFFDRGLIDAASALAFHSGTPIETILDGRPCYDETVIFAPPWPELFVSDAERKHGFDDALQEFHRLEAVLPALGYRSVTLPKTSLEERATFVLDALGLTC